MIYILTIFAWTGSQGIAINSQEYVGEQYCIQAAQRINSTSKSFLAICNAKGK